MVLQKELATALYWARMDRGLSLGDVGKETGLDPRTISDVEKGKTWPQGETAKKLKEFYPGVLDELI